MGTSTVSYKMLYQIRTLDVHSNGAVCTEEVVDTIGVCHKIRVYHENGAIRYEIPYANGCAHGTERRYDENGQLCMEVEWDSDELHGMTYAYDSTGALEYTQLYRYGELVNIDFV